MGDQAILSRFHRDIGIPINFQEESGLGKFSSIELRGPLEVSRNVRPPVEMRLGPRAFSRDYTEYSDIPLYCEMKDEPAFKPLQGNPTFSSQGISVSTASEAANSGSHSHTDC